jgi:hypothetical protein
MNSIRSKKGVSRREMPGGTKTNKKYFLCISIPMMLKPKNNVKARKQIKIKVLVRAYVKGIKPFIFPISITIKRKLRRGRNKLDRPFIVSVIILCIKFKKTFVTSDIYVVKKLKGVV